MTSHFLTVQTKVQVFKDDHNNLTKSSTWIEIYLLTIKSDLRFRPVFVAFLENLNLKKNPTRLLKTGNLPWILSVVDFLQRMITERWFTDHSFDFLAWTKTCQSSKENFRNTSIWRNFFQNKSRGLISLSCGTILKHKLSWVTQLCQCAGRSRQSVAVRRVH